MVVNSELLRLSFLICKKIILRCRPISYCKAICKIEYNYGIVPEDIDVFGISPIRRAKTPYLLEIIV